jgi:drug/metabolite transporter (DMT)-like permease
MQNDTRKLLTTGLGIFVTGLVAALLMLFVFGGVERRQGPHTTPGWLALMIAMGCLPTGALTLLLGLTKLSGDHSRTTRRDDFQ